MAEVIPESWEVVDQRVRDLVRYMKGTLPSVFDNSSDTAPSTSDLLQVLNELDHEFGSWHRYGIFRVLATDICDVIEPALEEAVVDYMNKLDQEQFGDDPEPQCGPVEVFWDDLFPVFQDGPVGDAGVLAGTAVSMCLNAVLGEDPAWGSLMETQTEIHVKYFNLFMGLVGFLFLVLYVRVVEQGLFPKIKYHYSPTDYSD